MEGGAATSDSGRQDVGEVETEGARSVCLGDGIELASVSIVFTTNRVLGQDVEAVFDPAQGDWACVYESGGQTTVRAPIGPARFGEPGTLISLAVGDGARLYDLAVDPDPPGSGSPGLVELSYAVPIEPASTASFGTIDQAGTETVDVVALPVAGSTELEFSAAGTIAGVDAWEFDFQVSAVVPVQ